MSRSKPSKKTDSSPTTNLRPEREQDNAASRAEISVYRQKIVELVEKSPQKAAVILTDWSKADAPSQNSKKAA